MKNQINVVPFKSVKYLKVIAKHSWKIVIFNFNYLIGDFRLEGILKQDGAKIFVIDVVLISHMFPLYGKLVKVLKR